MTKAPVTLGGLLMPVVMDSGYPLPHTQLLVLPRAWSSEGQGESAQQQSTRGDGPSYLKRTPLSVSWKEQAFPSIRQKMMQEEWLPNWYYQQVQTARETPGRFIAWKLFQCTEMPGVLRLCDESWSLRHSELLISSENVLANVSTFFMNHSTHRSSAMELWTTITLLPFSSPKWSSGKVVGRSWCCLPMCYFYSVTRRKHILCPGKGAHRDIYGCSFLRGWAEGWHIFLWTQA